MHRVPRPAVMICAVLALCSIQRSAFAANVFGIPLSTAAGDSSDRANDATIPRLWSSNSLAGTGSFRMRVISAKRSRSAGSVTSVRTSS